jgi:hypothetical protein
MTEKAKFEKTGMVIFPMKYIENEDYLRAHIICRNLEGEIIAMFIHPKEQDVLRAKNNSSSTIPLVETFAEEGRRARLPCASDIDNSKFKPFGIMLCEQVSEGKMFNIELGNETLSVRAYKCMWASVLREDESMPTPAIGLGYIEIGYAYGAKESPQSYQSIQSQIKQYQEMANNPNINPLDKESILQRKFEEITVQRKKMFAAVSIKHTKIIENVATNNMNDFRRLIESLAYPWSGNGRYGMVIIRVRQGNTILSKASTRFVTGYNYAENRILTENENWDSFQKYEMKYLSKWLNRGDISIDLIPAQRINYAYHGVEKCSNDYCRLSPQGSLYPASKMMKQYIDKDFHFRPDVDLVRNNAFLVSWTGVRLSQVRKGRGKGNEIASTIHSFSKVFGNALQVTRNLEQRYQMDNKAYKQEEKLQSFG